MCNISLLTIKAVISKIKGFERGSNARLDKKYGNVAVRTAQINEPVTATR